MTLNSANICASTRRDEESQQRMSGALIAQTLVDALPARLQVDELQIFRRIVRQCNPTFQNANNMSNAKMCVISEGSVVIQTIKNFISGRRL